MQGHGNLQAILLAGGRSSRMGRDKARLEFHGRPLWQHMHALLLAAGCSRVWISGDPSLAAGTPVAVGDFVPDRVADLGPLGGLDSVCHRNGAVAGDTWLVVPVDLPLLTVAALAPLCEAADAPSAHYAGHALPAVFRNTPELRNALASCLASDRRRDHSFIALHAALGARVLALPAEHEAALTNTNTPGEWADVLR